MTRDMSDLPPVLRFLCPWKMGSMSPLEKHRWWKRCSPLAEASSNKLTWPSYSGAGEFPLPLKWYSAIMYAKLLLSCLTLWDPMDCSPLGSSVHEILQAKNTRVGCHVLLQGVFPTQKSNLSLPHCRLILYQYLSRIESEVRNLSLKKIIN